MKLLHIPTGGVFPDGILNCILEYTKAMDKSNMEISVLAVNVPSREMVQKIETAGCRVIVIPERKSHMLRYMRRLYTCLKQNRFDIIHVHGSSALMSIELLTAWLAGCRVRIAHSHNTMCNNPKADKLLRPLFYRLYTQAFACGKAAGQWLFGGRKFIVVPNGRDLQKFQYEEAFRRKWREQLGMDKDCLAIGHVGRFTEQKNHTGLIEIFQAVKERQPQAKLFLMGDGRLMDAIKQCVLEKHLENDVYFLGNTDNVHEILSAMDLMVLPSRYEGLPLVVLEWQAAGLPCYISDVITDECIVRSNVKKLSLQESPSVWAEAIVHTSFADRTSEKDMIRNEMRAAGYDIVCAAKNLKNKYFELIYGENR